MNVHWSMLVARCRCRSCDRRSSSPRSPSRFPVGSAAFAWPSRSCSRYGRGLLKQFPGVPEGIVDVIPVDLVVAAICAVAARGESADERPDVVQVASGSVEPAATTRTWSTSCRVGSPSIRSMTTGANPSPSPHGPSPGAVACRSNSCGPRRASATPSDCSRCSRPRQASRVRRGARREARARRSCTRLRRALRRVRRMRSGLRARSAVRALGFARRR